MALTINNFAGKDALIVNAIGDSITAGGTAGGQSPGAWGWPDAPGGLYETIAPTLALKSGPSSSTRPARQSGRRTILAHGANAAVARPTSLKPAQLVKHGMGGSTVTFVTHWSTGHPETIDESIWPLFVTGRADLFIINWAVNDWVAINLSHIYDQALHAVAYGAVLDRIHADYPDAMVLCMGILFWDEAWSSSGGNHYTHPVNPFDNTNMIDVNIRALCAARPGWTEYCSLIDNALAYTVAHEPEPGPNGGAGWPGLLSMNGLHPTLLGQQQMGLWVAPHLNFVTT